VHRADQFGLSQLYQLRGRIGRAKQRGLCYLTTPPNQKLTDSRNAVCKSCNPWTILAPAFPVASHVGYQGAGNLWATSNRATSGESGIELYQTMLEEAVASLRAGRGSEDNRGPWSPQINLGRRLLLIPESTCGPQLRMAPLPAAG